MWTRQPRKPLSVPTPLGKPLTTGWVIAGSGVSERTGRLGLKMGGVDK